ncbi:hypothetical protein C8J32_1037 [Rhizobium sp. PP-CC-3A-592]|nr:hypothetical protein C8J32_1037 [Rhizobium sp. PP-CC-3A-592]
MLSLAQPFDRESRRRVDTETGRATILVDNRKVDPFRIKVATAPPYSFGIFGILPVGDALHEPLIARHAANTFGRSRPFAGDAASVFGCGTERSELLGRDGVPPVIPEIIVVAEDSTLLEVQQANFALIEDPRIVIGRILRQDFNVPIKEATDAKLIEMLVPPVERSLNSMVQMLQVPVDRQDQTAPDVRRDLVDGYFDLHSISGFEHCLNQHGWSKIVKTTARGA